MAQHNHNSQVLIKVADRQQHFGIRKLTIGAASVLLGTTLWLGGKANVVRADTQDDSANETPHEATQSSQSTPEINENTKVEVQVPTQNENISSTVNKVADSHTASDLENQQQAAETNSTVENQLAKGTKQEEQNAQSIKQTLARDDHQASLSINEDNTDESAQKVTKTENSKVQTDTTNVGEKAKSSNLDSLDLSTQKTFQNNFSTKQNNELNLKNGSLSSKSNVNLKNLYSQSKIQSNNTNNGGFDKATWGTLDVNDWDTQDDGTYFELTGYKGDFNHIIVPNAADFEKAGLDTNDEEVGVTSDLMHKLFLKADSDNVTVAFSKTDGNKVKATDSDWKQIYWHWENNDSDNNVTSPDASQDTPTAKLDKFDGSQLDTSNITNMEGMFGENNLSDLSSLSSWDTVSVTNMSDMFVGNQISNLSPLKNWDTRSVTDMSDMFVGNQISDLKPLSNWNVGNVTDMSDMFSDNQISNLNSLSNWDISNVTDMHDMFETNKIGSLTGLENWDTGNVTNMDNMFSDNQISDLTPLTNWNTQNATSMINMFLLDPVTKADFSKWSFNNIEKFSDDLEDIAGDFSGLQNFIDPEDKVLINLGNNDSLPDWFLSKTVSNDEGENYSNDNIFTSNKGNHIILTSTQSLLANQNKAYNTLTFSNGDTATIPVFINATPTTALNTVKSLVDEKVAAEKNKLGNNYTVTIDPSVDQTDPIALANAKFNVALIKTGTVNVFVHDNTSNLNLTDYNWTSNVNGKPQNVGSNVNYNKEQTITDLTNHGYVVINPDVEVPSTVAEGMNDITINVVHGFMPINPTNPGRPGQPINPDDLNGPKYPSDSGNLAVNITRTIHYINGSTGQEMSGSAPVTQTVTYTGSGVLDKVTGKWQTPLTWTAQNNKTTFDSVTSPAITGFHIIGVTRDSNDSINVAQSGNIARTANSYEVNVIYEPNAVPQPGDNDATEIINYIDEANHKQVGNQIIHGKIGQAISSVPNVPDGYDLQKNGKIQITFTSRHTNTIKVPVVEHVTTIDPDNVTITNPVWGSKKHGSHATVLAGTKNKHAVDDITYSDLHQDRTRTIVIMNPDGTVNPSTVIQEVRFKRPAIINAATGAVTFGDWVPADADGFAKLEVPKIAGYTPTQSEVAELDNVPSDYIDPHIVIFYKGNANTQTINYTDRKGNIINRQTVSGNNGQTVKVAPTIPDGWQVVSNQDAPTKVTLNPKDQPLNVTIEPITVTVEPDQVTETHPVSTKTIIPGTKNKHLKNDITYQDVHKAVTRTIKITKPNSSSTSIIQSVRFERTANIDATTGNVVYGKWTPVGKDDLDEITVPKIDGYTASTQVANINKVTDNYVDPKINITYIPDEQKQTIVYQDEQGNIVGQKEVIGKTAQILNTNLQAPDGYEVDPASKAPAQVTMTANSKPITVTVASKVTTIKADDVTLDKPISKNTVLPGTTTKHASQDINYGDVHKSVQRQIVITMPNGQQKDVTQTVQFERDAKINDATGKVIFGSWQVKGNDNFAKVDLPQVNGYIPTGIISGVEGITNSDNSQTLKISYVADTPANRLQVAKTLMANLQQAKNEAANKLTNLQKANTQAKEQSQQSQVAVEKQTTIVKNLQQRAQSTQSLLENLMTKQEQAQQKADQADKAFNDLNNNFADVQSQYDAKNKELASENAQVAADIENVKKLTLDLAETRKEIKDLESPAASDNNVEYIPIPMTDNLKQDLAQYKKDIGTFKTKSIAAYENGYNSNHNKYENWAKNGIRVSIGKQKDFLKLTPKIIETLQEIDGNNAVINDKEDFKNFSIEMENDGQQIIKDLMDVYKKPQIWNERDAQEKVDLSGNRNNLEHVTPAQEKEIEDYTFNLYNYIRQQLGLDPLIHSTDTEEMARKIAINYFDHNRSIFDGKKHDISAVNSVARSYNLKGADSTTGQQYESMDGWFADYDLGFGDIKDKNGNYLGKGIVSVPASTDESLTAAASGITNMDSIKQGIFANMIQMLVNDGTVTSNDWVHTVALLSLSYMGDYSKYNSGSYAKDPQYFFGNALSTMKSLEQEQNEKTGGYTYTHHLINVSSSDEEPGSSIKADGSSNPKINFEDPTQAKADKEKKLDGLKKKEQEGNGALNNAKEKQSEDAQKRDATEKIVAQYADILKSLEAKLGLVRQVKTAADQDLIKANAALQFQKNGNKEINEDAQKQQTILDSMKTKTQQENQQKESLDDAITKAQNNLNKANDDLNSAQKSDNNGQTTDNNHQSSGNGEMNQAPTSTQSGTTSATNNVQNSNPNTVQNTSSAASDTNGRTADNSESNNFSDDDDSDVATPSSRHASHHRSGNEIAPASESRNSARGRNPHGQIIAPEAQRNASGNDYTVSNIGSLGKSNTQFLPQTGEDNDSIAVALAGGIAISISLVGLAGIRKRRGY